MLKSARDALRGMLLHFVGGPVSRFGDETRLFHDLRVYGDDAYELLQQIHDAFGTSFRDLDFCAYFPNETEGGWTYRIDAFFRPSYRKKPLTLGHLVAVIEHGQWFEPAE
jgi:hypothetical protein